MAEINHLEEALSTSVKFYASLTRSQAKGTSPIGQDKNGNDVFVDPGAVCFVSDSKGNSIFLNKRLFGDGAVSGGGSSGGGFTEVTLEDITVIELDGEPLKTLADYFEADGTLITQSFKVTGTKQNTQGQPETYTAFEINSTGAYVNGKQIASQEWVLNQISQAGLSEQAVEEIKSQIASLKEDVEDYTKNLVSRVYKYKGTVQNYQNLLNIADPEEGDVYNMVNAFGNPGDATYYPAGTNFACIKDNNTISWDALGGTADLSNYVTNVGASVLIGDALQSANSYTDGKISSINGQLTTLGNSIQAHSATIGQLQTSVSNNSYSIQQNTTNITNIANQLTWQ